MSRARALGYRAVEILVAVAVATGAVAALESTTPAAGLGILYLLAIMAVAIRRGQLAALLAALRGIQGVRTRAPEPGQTKSFPRNWVW